jgi:hypothetical protein
VIIHDVDLELAISELRAACQGMRRGTITLRVERDCGITVHYHLDPDPLTDADINRMMRERPRGEKAHADA